MNRGDGVGGGEKWELRPGGNFADGERQGDMRVEVGETRNGRGGEEKWETGEEERGLTL